MANDTSDLLNQETYSGLDARTKLIAELPVTERTLKIADINTSVLEGGQGDPIVLLHGPGEYAAKWLRIIPDLAKTHRVIAPDLPGHGASEAPGAAPDPEGVLKWLDELINSTCSKPPVLIGQILGGAIASRYAGRYSNRISRLVLVDSLGLAPFQPHPDFGRALQEFMMRPTEETHDRFWNYCAFDLTSLQVDLGQRWELIKAYNLDRAGDESLRGTQQSLMEQFGFPGIPSDELERISVPTVLIWGKQDLATSVEVAEAASARYGWQLHVIENAADDPAMERPGEFLAVLRRVIENTSDGDKAAASHPSTRKAWDEIAAEFDATNTVTQMRIGSEGLRRANLRAGMTFLDVASGSGALSIPAARLGAQVLSVDQSPIMLKLLEKRAESEGLAIETRVMDGHALSIDDNTFDMAGSQFGVMLFPDMPRGISEMVRVVKPGGRVLIHAYGDPPRIEFLNFFVAALRSVRPHFNGLPKDPPPLEFQLAIPDRLGEALRSAGLKDVGVETVIERTQFTSGDDLWRWIVASNPIAERILSEMLRLTDAERDAARLALGKMVRDRAGTSGAAELTNPVNIGMGTK